MGIDVGGGGGETSGGGGDASGSRRCSGVEVTLRCVWLVSDYKTFYNL